MKDEFTIRIREKSRTDLFECECGSRLVYKKELLALNKDKSFAGVQEIHYICNKCNKIVHKEVFM